MSAIEHALSYGAMTKVGLQAAFLRFRVGVA
jgi:hypothetical protein